MHLSKAPSGSGRLVFEALTALALLLPLSCQAQQPSLRHCQTVNLGSYHSTWAPCRPCWSIVDHAVVTVELSSLLPRVSRHPGTVLSSLELLTQYLDTVSKTTGGSAALENWRILPSSASQLTQPQLTESIRFMSPNRYLSSNWQRVYRPWRPRDPYYLCTDPRDPFVLDQPDQPDHHAAMLCHAAMLPSYLGSSYLPCAFVHMHGSKSGVAPMSP